MLSNALPGLIAALLVTGASLHAANPPLTIHDLTAIPQPHSPAPIWRPDGKLFAYRDKQNLMLYDTRSGRSATWLSVEALESSVPAPPPPSAAQPFNWQNRRLNGSAPQWFPDGNALLVPTRNATFVVAMGATAARETLRDITDANVPSLSPDGRRVLYRKEGNLYVYDLQERRTTQLTSDATLTLFNGELDWVYPEELEIGTAFWWAPDGQHIAYMQFNVAEELLYPHADLLSLRAVAEPQRYPQAGTPNALVKLGIVSVAGGATRWIDLGPDRDILLARVNWLPDSRRIAFERVNRHQNRLDLLIASADGTEPPTVTLTESDRYWVNVNDDLHFLGSSHTFIWASERTGFKHLYLYSESGQIIRQITSGNWQVNRVAAVNEDTRTIFYTSAEASPLQDQLYTVSFDGGPSRRLTEGAGVHEVAVEPKGRFYVDAFSNSATAPRAAIYSAAGQEISPFRVDALSAAANFETLPSEIVEVPAADGTTTLYGRLTKPASFDASKHYPAVVFVYGGPHAQLVHDVWTGLSWQQVLAQRGFVVWELDNRGTFGRGHAFEVPIYHELGKTELADQRAGLEKLLAMGFVDRDRIGLYGWSYGGFMTLYSLLHAPGVFKAGIAGAPVTDWHNYDTIYTERYMGLPAENEEGYRKSSNSLAASGLSSKLLIVCNFEDDNVLFQNSMQMMTALHRANKEFDFMLYPQKTHGVTGPISEGMYQQMTGFFVDALRP